ncbi:uncharacterized protein PHALS_10904 [Plasmopara halstedii]|uniref:Uncharacterized protein n=1 Tax=Plasmopara halstedii TaxID=4781 RepID=A0A0P1AHX3_PLAHL|nr:uncharacterized protein PHALS_10904 [Plasmopara halstedii]CEG40720.1 hypothetical protein PHALS_10904 [Plasmopara halstedii]|eukprot:XP_024577089.1 hypothetical protein PHALS_10904 [Plasmopara halstedii]
MGHIPEGKCTALASLKWMKAMLSFPRRRCNLDSPYLTRQERSFLSASAPTRKQTSTTDGGVQDLLTVSYSTIAAATTSGVAVRFPALGAGIDGRS